MNSKLLLLPALAVVICSCSSLKSGYDGLASGTGSAWKAVKDAGGAVASGTANIGKKTAELTGDASSKAARLATGKLKAEPNVAEITLSLDGRKGVVTMTLDEQAAPEHVKNFRKLVKEGYYNGMGVHRAVPGTLIQTGDPRSRNDSARAVWGLGGPGYTLPAEIGLRHKRGSVGMARLGDRLNPTRQSNGSQFYICLRPMPALDGNYTVFGRVTSGIEFADAVAQTPADENDAPVRMVKIESLRLIDGTAGVAPPKGDLPPAAPHQAMPDTAYDLPPAATPGAPDQGVKVPDSPKKPRGWFGRQLDKVW